MKIKKAMKVLCEEKLAEAKKLAAEIGDTSLQDCLDRLESWEKKENFPVEVTLYSDFAPHSFGFSEKYLNTGVRGLVGGLLYHGGPDQSYSVQLCPKIGWEIHT